MHFRNAVLAAVALGVASQPARACEYDPFLFQLPGETAAIARSRSDQIMSDSSIIRAAAREDYAFGKATVVYLARKVAVSDDPKTGDRLTLVHPVFSVRGALPKGDEALRLDAGMGGMCGTVGDGDTAHLPNGSYVVVFDGLPRDTYRPRGIDSFNVNDIRNGELLDALRSFGKDLE